MVTATWQHHAFKIGDVKDTDLNNTSMIGIISLKFPVAALTGVMGVMIATGSGIHLGKEGSTQLSLPLDDTPLFPTVSSNFVLGGVFFPVQATTASAPAALLGGMYFDTTLGKLRVCEVAGTWRTVTTT